jgi:hypothetical protein
MDKAMLEIEELGNKSRNTFENRATKSEVSDQEELKNKVDQSSSC